MRKPKKILIIVQRSNGDVFLSLSLLTHLAQHFNHPQIDILVNDDTLAIAKLLPFITNIHTFSYAQKKENRWGQEFRLFKKIHRKYDLSINLTASDRSVLYAFLSGKHAISAIESDKKKSWWKKLALSQYYYFDTESHIVCNNLAPLDLLKIKHQRAQKSIEISPPKVKALKTKLEHLNIGPFIIFHPSAQYNYKVYPKKLRDELLTYLSGLGIDILITGGQSKIDDEIKKTLPLLSNSYDFIGETSLEDYFYLSHLSLGYIGMDTLNMHIAASQDKRIFTIFGPTNLKMWSPWSNQLQRAATEDKPLQTYGNITLFQANMPCVACGLAGCDNNNSVSECLNNIAPSVIFSEIKKWYENVGI